MDVSQGRISIMRVRVIVIGFYRLSITRMRIARRFTPIPYKLITWVTD